MYDRWHFGYDLCRKEPYFLVSRCEYLPRALTLPDIIEYDGALEDGLQFLRVIAKLVLIEYLKCKLFIVENGHCDRLCPFYRLLIIEFGRVGCQLHYIAFVIIRCTNRNT